MSARNVREFDMHAIVQQFGYNDVDHYYSDSSAKHVVGRIQVPTLSLTAQDDPVCSAEGVPQAQDMGPGLVSVQTTHGGHVAFGQGWFGEESWQDDVIVEWLNAVRQSKVQ